MDFRCNQFRDPYLRRNMATVGPSSRSGLAECRYNSRKDLFPRLMRPRWTILPSPIGGRAPPGRRRRPELQALSNSLQLT